MCFLPRLKPNRKKKNNKHAHWFNATIFRARPNQRRTACFEKPVVKGRDDGLIFEFRPESRRGAIVDYFRFPKFFEFFGFFVPNRHSVQETEYHFVSR